MKKKLCVFALLISIFLLSLFVEGETKSASTQKGSSTSVFGNSLDIYYFYGEGCPHCAKVQPFLDEMMQKYPLNIHRYDIHNSREYISLFDDFSNRYGLEERGVPTIFISDTYLVGDNPILGEFEEVVREALQDSSLDTKTLKIENNAEATSEASSPSILTVTIAGLVDSISPCSIAILVFLIGARVLVDKKKRILRVGLAFCLSVFIAYFLFGLGLLTFVQVSGYSHLFSLLAGLVTILIGLFYLKDVFFYGKTGFVMEVPNSLKPLLMQMLKSVTSPIGVFLMGFVVVCFELPCTGGPYLFILGQLADTTTRLQAIPLLLYYNFLFVLPLIIISIFLFSNFFSISKIRAWNEQNRRLFKLIGGSAMISLSFLVIPLTQVLEYVQIFLCIFKVTSIALLTLMFLATVVSFTKQRKLPDSFKGILLISILLVLLLNVPRTTRANPRDTTIHGKFLLNNDGNRVGDCHQSKWRNQGKSKSSIVNGETNYTYYAEETAKMAWEYAWDSQYGGYYRENNREWATVNDDRKLIAETTFYTYGLMYLYDRTGNSTYLTWASNATDYTINNAWDPEGGVYETYDRSWSNTTCVKLLGDQAWLLYSLLEIYNRTGDTNYYYYANKTANFIMDRYHDATNGGFYINWNECTKTATTDKDAEVMGAASWALMEWYRYTGNQTAYDWAQETNDFIWDCLYDTTYDGLMTKANADCSRITNDKKYPNEILWGITGMLNFYNQTSNSTLRSRIGTVLNYINATMWDWNEVECTQAPCGGWFRSLWRDNSIRDETKDGWTQSEQLWLWYYAYEMIGGNQTYLQIARRSANWTRDHNFDDTYKGFFLELNRDGTCCTSGSDVKFDWVEGGGITAFAYVTTGLEHDIATTLVTPSKTIIGQGYTVPINVTVGNHGYYTETFNVTTYYNDTVIILPNRKNYKTLTLSSGESTIITFTWNTADVPYGNYTISAVADTVPGETHTADNLHTDGTVLVTIPGDVNGDKVVDLFDAASISAHWYPGPPVGPLAYGSNADINNDGAVNILDVAIVSAYWTGPPKGPLDP